MNNKKKLLGMSVISKSLLVCLFVVLLFLSAKSAVVWEVVTPVPITFQVFFVLLAGFVLGSHLAVLAVSIYLIMGLLGLPVFASGEHGFNAFTGETGGYLLAFIPCAISTGVLKQKSPLGTPFRAIFIKCLNSYFIVLMIGCVMLMNVNQLSLAQTFSAGFSPFIPGMIIHCAMATSLYCFLMKKGLICT